METIFPNLFSGKKVIIIGPSRKVFDKMRENKVNLDEYDLVIKLNHHWINIKEKEFKRTDIVYHGLNVNRTQPRQIHAMAKENFLVIARAISRQKLNKYIFMRSLGVKCVKIPEDFIKDVKTKLKSFPLMGTLCVLHVASFNPASIDCYGFDFYRTSYFKVEGKRLIRNNKPIRRDNKGIHSIKRQKKNFFKIIRKIPFINFF